MSWLLQSRKRATVEEAFILDEALEDSIDVPMYIVAGRIKYKPAGNRKPQSSQVFDFFDIGDEESDMHASAFEFRREHKVSNLEYISTSLLDLLNMRVHTDAGRTLTGREHLQLVDFLLPVLRLEDPPEYEVTVYSHVPQDRLTQGSIPPERY